MSITAYTTAYALPRHRLISSEELASCQRCGALFQTDTDGHPVASNGDPASACVPGTEHGDPRENGHDLDCECCARGDWCAAYSTGCNCAYCA